MNKITLIGNPNCGKTTLFNLLTGSRQRVGNWPGVTVEKKVGLYRHNNIQYEMTDLPGTYTLEHDETASQDEQIAREYVLTHQDDVVVNIIDATNLQRSLYLTYQLLDLNMPLIVVLNMMDDVDRSGVKIDVEQLQSLLGCPVVPMTATKKKGITQFNQALEEIAHHKSKAKPTISTLMDKHVNAIARHHEMLPADSKLKQLSTWQMTHALMDHTPFNFNVDEIEALERSRNELAAWCDNQIDIAIASSRYESIDALAKKVIYLPREASSRFSEKLDAITLNRFFGIPLFLVMMYLMFLVAVNVGKVFVDFFDILFGAIFVDGFSLVLENIGSPAWLNSILAYGIGTGIQTVSTFIPVIAAMFFCLSLLEDSGYLARAAVVVDKGMKKIGLPGKAFVPMLVGFGCNVPAIMGTRTLDSSKDRILSICMIPFMSCSARLPVYALLTVIFFPNNATIIVFGLYLLGIAAAILTGFILKHTILKGELSPFIMEMPVYRLPTWRNIFGLTWQRLKSFILKAGKAIVIMVTILSFLNSLGTDGSFGHQDSKESVLSVISQKITPVFEPMGVTEQNWPATVGVFTGIFAKEAVLGTLNSLYSMENETDNEFDFMDSVKNAVMSVPENMKTLGHSLLDPLGFSEIEEGGGDEVADSARSNIETSFGSSAAALAYLIFILLYTPCTAALGAVFREAGIKWMMFVAIWTLWIGWSFATLYYQFIQLSTINASFFWIILTMVLFLAVIGFLWWIGRRNQEYTINTSGKNRQGCC